MSEAIPKTGTANPLPWGYEVYQVMAVLVFVASIILSALIMLTTEFPEQWVFILFLLAVSGVIMTALVRAISRLKAGGEFSIFWLPFIIGTRRWKRSASSPLSSHLYSLGHISAMIAMFFFITSALHGVWAQYALWLCLSISALFVGAGYEVSSKKPSKKILSPASAQE